MNQKKKKTKPKRKPNNWGGGGGGGGGPVFGGDCFLRSAPAGELAKSSNEVHQKSQIT